MAYTDEQLVELRKKLSGRDNLNKTIQTLLLKKGEIEKRLKPLEQSRDKEHSDVEKLEKGGVKSFFYSLIGQKVERLNKEKDEAYEADKKYEAVYKEYSALCDTLEFYLNELKELNECDRTFDMLIGEKKLAMKKAGHPLMEEIEREEKLLIRIAGQIQDIEQLISDVGEAKEIATELSDETETVYEYAVRDTKVNQRPYDRIKNRHINEVQRLAEILNRKLSLLSRQLSAIDEATYDVKVEISKSIRLLDRIDFPFASFAMLGTIENVLEKTKEAEEQITSLEFRLKELSDEKLTDYTEVRQRLDDMVIDAKL